MKQSRRFVPRDVAVRVNIQQRLHFEKNSPRPTPMGLLRLSCVEDDGRQRRCGHIFAKRFRRKSPKLERNKNTRVHTIREKQTGLPMTVPCAGILGDQGVGVGAAQVVLVDGR